MKSNIHPQYYPKTKTKCICGNSFTIGSTKQEIQTEICGNCHPFYTGKEKLIDSAGRIEKFKARLREAETNSSKKKVKRTRAKKK
ncbi:MAG TPA: 50S ribosomal protein L31 [Candidatus Wolfebacteria bacterium]|nr:50S ribosomal protein L31 [Candidatus Wolfebacteria bacterium]